MACRDAEKGPRGEAAAPTYAEGFEAGYRAGLAAGGRIPGATWRALLQLVHPDKHHGGALEVQANAATVWLLEHRPTDGGTT